MQLHYASVIQGLGNLMCIGARDLFQIELESAQGRRNIDIACGFGDIRAAIELKCFRKTSNRAGDLDRYDVLKDIQRLQGYQGFAAKRLICLSDDERYVNDEQTRGYSAEISIAHGQHYPRATTITPPWVGKWKDKSRDVPIHLDHDVTFDWVQNGGWYYLCLDVPV